MKRIAGHEVDVIGASEDDPDAAAVGECSARAGGREGVVRILHAKVELLPEFIARSSEGGIATSPEEIDEATGFLIALQTAPLRSLAGGHDPRCGTVAPLFVGRRKSEGRSGEERCEDDGVDEHTLHSHALVR